jgi:hypothetical protein
MGLVERRDCRRCIVDLRKAPVAHGCQRGDVSRAAYGALYGLRPTSI